MSQQTGSAVVAIDGPGGAGKGTISRLIAERLDWHLLDSGALYRLTALAAERRGIDMTDAAALETIARELDVVFVSEGEHTCIMLEGEDVSSDIRNEHVGGLASQVAALQVVREALLARQRDFATSPGLVADGRDMGTVVFPEAPLKIFLTASAEERARRRFDQLRQAGQHASLSSLLKEIEARDARDTQRAVAPLRPAEDAITIDTTELSIPDVVARIEALLSLRGLIVPQ
ncbi:cytidylate kinase [Kushneria avicenniae]|uniref:Cytidylate kinase n=1 Tax=Kushneria avicenniae TaxID=402385 RepID=A0A1I1M493_9GAMM|nr:(d)CMP kinase [Kushneria avicenniae]SFC80201.1 cytidylate kinase [Kushneria avicenniae]